MRGHRASVSRGSPMDSMLVPSIPPKSAALGGQLIRPVTHRFSSVPPPRRLPHPINAPRQAGRFCRNGNGRSRPRVGVATIRHSPAGSVSPVAWWPEGAGRSRVTWPRSPVSRRLFGHITSYGPNLKFSPARMMPKLPAAFVSPNPRYSTRTDVESVHLLSTPSP